MLRKLLNKKKKWLLLLISFFSSMYWQVFSSAGYLFSLFSSLSSGLTSRHLPDICWGSALQIDPFVKQYFMGLVSRDRQSSDLLNHNSFSETDFPTYQGQPENTGENPGSGHLKPQCYLWESKIRERLKNTLNFEINNEFAI